MNQKTPCASMRQPPEQRSNQTPIDTESRLVARLGAIETVLLKQPDRVTMQTELGSVERVQLGIWKALGEYLSRPQAPLPDKTELEVLQSLTKTASDLVGADLIMVRFADIHLHHALLASILRGEPVSLPAGSTESVALVAITPEGAEAFSIRLGDLQQWFASRDPHQVQSPEAVLTTLARSFGLVENDGASLRFLEDTSLNQARAVREKGLGEWIISPRGAVPSTHARYELLANRLVTSVEQQEDLRRKITECSSNSQDPALLDERRIILDSLSASRTAEVAPVRRVTNVRVRPGDLGASFRLGRAVDGVSNAVYLHQSRNQFIALQSPAIDDPYQIVRIPLDEINDRILRARDIGLLTDGTLVDAAGLLVVGAQEQQIRDQYQRVRDGQPLCPNGRAPALTTPPQAPSRYPMTKEQQILARWSTEPPKSATYFDPPVAGLLFDLGTAIVFEPNDQDVATYIFSRDAIKELERHPNRTRDDTRSIEGFIARAVHRGTSDYDRRNWLGNVERAVFSV